MDTTGVGRPGSTVVVVTGGEPPDMAAGRALPVDCRVVAADSGGDTALVLGLVVDELVGDLDSISSTGLEAIRTAGASIERHEPDKDSTDLELALTAALRHSPSSILVLGGLGGRADHELANLLLVSSADLAAVDVTLRSGACTVQVVRPGRPTTLCGTAGDVISLIPVHGTVRGVTASGVRWPLDGAELTPGTTLGVSNEVLDPEASVSCAAGVLLAIQPGVRAAVMAPRSSTQPPLPEVSS